jgi:hypothetical protein
MEGTVRILLAAVIASSCFAGTADAAGVRGHVTRKGTYVQPHARTNPDRSKANNYSSKGNVNPYTGKKGTVDPYAPRPSRQH